MIYGEVIKRIADELKVDTFDTVWVSPVTWNALKASCDGLEAHDLDGERQYAVPLITAGRRFLVFCDPSLGDQDLLTVNEDEDEEEEPEET